MRRQQQKNRSGPAELAEWRELALSTDFRA
jgi:hypothetical protein